MENNELIILTQNSLRSLVKIISALKLQVIQLENQVRELRLNLIKEVKQ